MKFSTNAQNVVLPLVLSFGNIWIPKRLFVRSYETGSNLRQVGESKLKETDTKTKNEIPRTGAGFPRVPEAVFGAKKNADLGILSPAKIDPQRRLEEDATCHEFVECVNGYVLDDGDGALNVLKSCHEECGGSCCDLPDSCENFTGKLCKDNKSCMGNGACRGATVGFVIGSCDGDQACQEANLGSSANMTNSCNGEQACYRAAYTGSLGNLLQSCNEESACHQIAYEGTVGGLTYSCNNFKSCYGVAGDANDSYLDFMQNCCNDSSECAVNKNGNSNGLPADCFASPMSYGSPTARPSASSVPSISLTPTKSASPSSSPIDVEQQILTTMNDIKSDTNQIKSYMNQLDAKIDNSATCQSVQAEIKFHSTDSFESDSSFSTTLTDVEGTNIFVHLTSEGVGVDADRNPSDASDILIDIFSLDDNMDEVEVSKRAITKIASGMYVIMIVDAYPIYWMKFYVNGKEQTVAFKINA